MKKAERMITDEEWKTIILMRKWEKLYCLKTTQKKNRFHIVPKSRGGKGMKDNVCLVNIYLHHIYHELTDAIIDKKPVARKPDEIIVYLVKKLWNNQWYWVEKALKRKEDISETKKTK